MFARSCLRPFLVRGDLQNPSAGVSIAGTLGDSDSNIVIETFSHP